MCEVGQHNGGEHLKIPVIRRKRNVSILATAVDVWSTHFFTTHIKCSHWRVFVSLTVKPQYFTQST